jgi:hypothetical protein
MPVKNLCKGPDKRVIIPADFDLIAVLRATCPIWRNRDPMVPLANQAL